MPTVTGVAVGTVTVSGAVAVGTRVVTGVAVGTITIDLAQAGIPGDVVLSAELLPSPFTADLLS
jgi:hypothetical protein